VVAQNQRAQCCCGGVMQIKSVTAGAIALRHCVVFRAFASGPGQSGPITA
jgi:hypothetical protein